VVGVPDRRARRRAVLAFGALGIWWGAWGALLPLVQRSAGVDDTQLGTALLLVGAGALATMRVAGHLVDRLGWVVLPVTVAGLGMAGIGPALVDGVLALSASLALVGAASGAFDVAINAEANRVEAATGRPLLSLAHAAFSFGVIGGSLGAGALRTIDVSLTAALTSFGVVLVAIAAWLAAGPSRHPGAPAGAMATDRWPWWRPPRPLAVLGVLIALAFLVESAWQNWSAVHLERDLHASPWLASVGPAVFGASAGVGRLLAHRWVAPGREAQVVAGGAVVAALATVGAALAPLTALVLGGIALAGLGTAACAPSLFRLAGAAVPSHLTGAAVGTVTTVGYLGFVIAPALVGGLAGALTLPTALAVVSVAALALAAGAWRVDRRPLAGRTLGAEENDRTR
jgi:MFS family permease